MTFHREYSDWPLKGYEHLMITYIEATGETIEEMIETCEFSLENWHGDEGPRWCLSDLPHEDHQAVLNELIRAWGKREKRA